ncbi:MAG: DNA-binding protein [Clostridia bacterium]|nr:DNA-binding protein [Clostridia bacterium]
MICFGFDTSNYTTSTAAFGEGVHSNHSRLLPVPDAARGLRQSDALFHHVKALPELFRALSDEVGKKPDAVAVSVSPRRAEGSYMPCFLAGKNAAEILSAGLSVPLYRFSHQEGHLAAAAYSSGNPELLKSPFLAWHLSGGTTELLYCEPGESGSLCVRRIGGTKDISAGQCVDRAGVALGLRFPAGGELEKLSLSGSAENLYRTKRDGLYFHLSGMENQFNALIANGRPPEDVAAFVLKSLEKLVAETTENALALYPGLPVLCSGGVMSCRSLSREMKRLFGAYTAEPALSRDNALGVAILGYLANGGDEA